MLIKRIFFLLIVLTFTSTSFAQSSLNWSLKSLVNNIQKIKLPSGNDSKRADFFQTQNFNDQVLNLKSSATRVSQRNKEQVEVEDDLVLYDYTNAVSYTHLTLPTTPYV